MGERNTQSTHAMSIHYTSHAQCLSSSSILLIFYFDCMWEKEKERSCLVSCRQCRVSGVNGWLHSLCPFPFPHPPRPTCYQPEPKDGRPGGSRNGRKVKMIRKGAGLIPFDQSFQLVPKWTSRRHRGSAPLYDSKSIHVSLDFILLVNVIITWFNQKEDRERD